MTGQRNTFTWIEQRLKKANQKTHQGLTGVQEKKTEEEEEAEIKKENIKVQAQATKQVKAYTDSVQKYVKDLQSKLAIHNRKLFVSWGLLKNTDTTSGSASFFSTLGWDRYGIGRGCHKILVHPAQKGLLFETEYKTVVQQQCNLSLNGKSWLVTISTGNKHPIIWFEDYYCLSIEEFEDAMREFIENIL